MTPPSRAPDGAPPPPVVQRLRVQYAKRGRLRFSSHRDFQRVLERAIRRSRIPIGFSAGFTAHPKISYANAAPTGAASEAEYVELGVVEECDPDAVRTALDESLPDDFVVLAVVDAAAWTTASGGTTPLADLLEASRWEMVLPKVAAAEATQAVETFLALDHVEVTRMTKNGRRSFDARAAVVRLGVRPEATRSAEVVDGVAGEGACAIIDLVVRHDQPTVRPDDVLTGLRLSANLVPPEPPRLRRLAQGPLDPQTGEVSDPLVAPRRQP